MKNSSFFTAQLGVFAVFFVFLTGCVSAPAEKNIWDLLRSGDKNARGYFLGEVEVNAADEEGKTPLHYAAEMNDAPLAGFFISIGANPNRLDNSMRSPLGISIENRNAGVTRTLVAGGANIHLPIRNDETAASLALKRGPSVFNSILTPASIESSDSSGKTVLHMAAIAGNVRAVQDIIEITSSSSLINKNDKESKNALDYAFENSDSKSHMEIAELLILSGGFSENAIFNYFGPAVRSANFNIRRNEGLALIHYAVMNGHSGLISFLLEKKIDINIKTTSGATALHEAARIGNYQIITMIVSAGADVNARDANNNTPLHTGIPAEVHKDVVGLLLSAGADPNLRDVHGDTPLHIAVVLNRPADVIQSLISGGSDVHIRNIQGKTPLYIAVEERRDSIIPILLKNGSEIFAADNSGVTPFDKAVKSSDSIFSMMITPETVIQRDSAGNTMLHAAVRNRANPVQIARILDAKAHVDARNREGDTALHIAVRMNQRESSEFLISRGASIFSINSAGQSPLYIAFTSNGGIREWIINPTTINSRDGLGNNMLHYAAEWKLNNVIPVVIRNGLSVEEANATGETPLFMAVKTNSASTIRVLVDNKANLNARDSQGNSVLHTAVRWNAKDAVEMLIAYKMDINSHSLNGNTPLHDAVIFRMPDIELLLIKHNANLEARNIDGNTPFMEAVRYGIVPSVERLAHNMSDISTRNTRGDTPLHIAVSTEQIDIVNTLLRMGASIHARNTRNITPFQLSLGISPVMVSTLLTADRVNISDDFGNSALHIALQEKTADNILRTIISKGVRLNVVDSNGRTPLRLAVDMNVWESAKMIADAGADPFLSAVDNKTPAEIAFTKGNTCIRALFSGRAINARDSSGNTILHIAAHQSTPETINLLLELGANKTIKNIASELPLDIALRWNRSDNADILR